MKQLIHITINNCRTNLIISTLTDKVMANEEHKKSKLSSDSCKDIALALILLTLALFSRIYYLNEFPYFPPENPWVGRGGQGLYTDEYVYYSIAVNLLKNPLNPTLYQPWLQLLMVGASTSLLGGNVFAVRLPSAIMSSISVVLVYYICKKKFKSRTAALLSSLYLIIMMPALILNRMAFLENSVVMFFLASYLCLLRYSESAKGRYLLLAAVFSGLSVLSKIDGLIAPIFLLIYLIRAKTFLKNIRYILLTLAIVFIFPIIASIVLNVDYLQLLTQLLSQWQIGTIGNEFSIWTYMLLNTMPSGAVIYWGNYLPLEYWYIFAYFALAYVAITEFDKVSDVVIAIAAFLCLFFLVGLIGSYYLIIIQPFLAIPIGYAITKLIRMPTSLTTFFYIFLYAPVTLSVDIYLSMSDKSGVPILQNNPLAILLKLTNIALPLLLIIIPPLLKQRLQKDYKSIANTILIAAFFAFLLIGSYILPVFYPQYLTLTP